MKEKVFTRHQTYYCLDLGLPNPQSYKQCIPVVYELPSLWYSVPAARTKTPFPKELLGAEGSHQ